MSEAMPHAPTSTRTRPFGAWQRSIIRQLLAGCQIPSPLRQLRGRARNYSGKYQASFSTVLDYLRASGYTVVRTPGPRGGEWAATYHLDFSREEQSN